MIKGETSTVEQEPRQDSTTLHTNKEALFVVKSAGRVVSKPMPMEEARLWALSPLTKGRYTYLVIEKA
jgi:hypothetical protein